MLKGLHGTISANKVPLRVYFKSYFFVRSVSCTHDSFEVRVLQNPALCLLSVCVCVCVCVCERESLVSVLGQQCYSWRLGEVLAPGRMGKVFLAGVAVAFHCARVPLPLIT